MYPYLFNGDVNISTFSVMITLGAVAALGVFFIQIKTHKINRDTADLLLIMIPVMFLGGFFFGMVYDKIAHWGEGGSPWYKPAGIAFAGGLVGAFVLFLVVYPLVLKKPRRDLMLHLDIFTPCLILAHSFGRVGCFLGGCCYGKPTDSFLGVAFPEGSPAYNEYVEKYGEEYIHQHGMVKVLPTQLFEAAFLLLLFFAIFFFVRKYKVAIYLMAYATFRFCIEFLRGDNRGNMSEIFSPSQILSFIIFAGGVVMFFMYKKHITQNHLDTIAMLKAKRRKKKTKESDRQAAPDSD